MRKIILFALAFLILGTQSFAQNLTAVYEYSYAIDNNTGEPKATVIPTTSIRPNTDKLTAYLAIPFTSGHTETFIAVFDDTTTEMSGEKLGEQEAANGFTAGERFVRPKKISNGVVVWQGANTSAVIHFVRE